MNHNLENEAGAPDFVKDRNVRFGSLYHDCVSTYDQLLENRKTESFHYIKLKEKNL